MWRYVNIWEKKSSEAVLLCCPCWAPIKANRYIFHDSRAHAIIPDSSIVGCKWQPVIGISWNWPWIASKICFWSWKSNGNTVKNWQDGTGWNVFRRRPIHKYFCRVHSASLPLKLRGRVHPHVDYGTTDASESPMSMQGPVTKAYWLRIGDGVWWVHISSASHFPRRNIMCRNGHGVHGPRVGEFAA